MQAITTQHATIAYQCIDNALRIAIEILMFKRITLSGHAKGMVTKQINKCRTAQMISESMQAQLDMPSTNTAESYAQQLEWATMQAEKALGFDGCFLRSTIREAIEASEQAVQQPVQQPVQQAVQDRQAMRAEYGLIVERLQELATHDSCIDNEYCATATVIHIVAEYIQGKVQPCIVQYCAIDNTFMSLQQVLACAMLHDTWQDYKHVPLDADLMTYCKA